VTDVLCRRSLLRARRQCMGRRYHGSQDQILLADAAPGQRCSRGHTDAVAYVFDPGTTPHAQYAAGRPPRTTGQVEGDLLERVGQTSAILASAASGPHAAAAANGRDGSACRTGVVQQAPEQGGKQERLSSDSGPVARQLSRSASAVEWSGSPWGAFTPESIDFRLFFA
jgi:hypothetical protein